MVFRRALWIQNRIIVAFLLFYHILFAKSTFREENNLKRYAPLSVRIYLRFRNLRRYLGYFSSSFIFCFPKQLWLYYKNFMSYTRY